jgi:hypothetical protein
MNRLACRVAALGLFVGSRAALAAEWQKVAEGEISDRVVMTTLVDVESIKHRDGLLSAWLKVTYSSPQKDRYTGAPYLSERDLYAYDCDGERYTMVSATQYSGADLNGVPVGSPFEQQPPLRWFHPGPGTSGGDTLSFVCAVAKAGR